MPFFSRCVYVKPVNLCEICVIQGIKITKWFYQIIDPNSWCSSKTPMNCSFFFSKTFWSNEIVISICSTQLPTNCWLDVSMLHDAKVTIGDAHCLLIRRHWETQLQPFASICFWDMSSLWLLNSISLNAHLKSVSWPKEKTSYRLIGLIFTACYILVYTLVYRNIINQ